MEEAAVETIYSCTYAKKKTTWQRHDCICCDADDLVSALILVSEIHCRRDILKEVLYISSGHVVNCWKHALLVLIKAIIESESTRHFASLQFRCQYWK